MTPKQNQGAGKRRSPAIPLDYYENKSEQRATNLFYVFYSGEVTERNYFEGLRDSFAHKNKIPSQFVHLQYAKGTPRQVVESAIDKVKEQRQEINDNLKDKIWVVFDKDDFKENYSCAVSTAINSHLQVAYSNVCFELWLLLYFQDVSEETELRRSRLKKLLLKILEEHSGKPAKSKYIVKHFPYGLLLKHGNKNAAIKRAESLLKKAKEKNPTNPHDINPVTNVHSLVKDLEMFFQTH
ncbi:MAG: RloB family protein [Planctomycetaceae bacterium]|jgi:hypothetical protein|nr:RloB family protein [Planctomycetaceae bacterium]